TQDEQQLEQAWELSGRKLKAWYDQEETRLTGLAQEVQREQDALAGQRQDSIRERDAAIQERDGKRLDIRGLEKELDEIQKQQSGIAQRILTQSSSQTVEEQMPIWLTEQQQLEQQSLEMAKTLQELSRRKSERQSEAKQVSEEQLTA